MTWYHDYDYCKCMLTAPIQNVIIHLGFTEISGTFPPKLPGKISLFQTYSFLHSLEGWGCVVNNAGSLF